MPTDEMYNTLDDAINTLGEGFQSTAELANSFSNSLYSAQDGLNAASFAADGIARKLSTELSSAFKNVVIEGGQLSDALNSIGQTMANTVLQNALNPIQTGLGDFFQTGIGKLLPFANGGVMTSGRVTAFARGGVVEQPTNFAMRGGMGLMGEAGPEAIMPLTRGSDGALGVKVSGGGGQNVNVTMNISTPDAAGFQRSRAQIAAGLRQAIARGQRNA